MCNFDEGYEKRTFMDGNRDSRRKEKRRSRHRASSMAGALLLSASLLSGCTFGPASAAGDSPADSQQAASATNLTVNSAAAPQNSDTALVTVTSPEDVTYDFDTVDLDAGWNSSTASKVTLNGDSIEFSGSGASVSGRTLTITAAGTYVIGGNLDDGQIIVFTEEKDAVRLVLNGADISCSDMSPIYVMGAEKVVLVLADGTENKVTDGSSYPNVDAESGEPNAAIFSKSDLTINGTGSLSVTGNFKHGIVSKDALKVISGTLDVAAASDGLRGRDLVAVKGGDIRIQAGSDGIQSNNDEDAGKGFVAVEGGTIFISAARDGIQAETYVMVRAGDFSITTGGGAPDSPASGSSFGGGMDAGNPNKTTDSCKAIKAGLDILLTGGTFAINSADDALHASGTIAITETDITLATGDDGIHADTEILYNSGSLVILSSYEAVESANITVNGGSLTLNSTDDGFNVSGGNDASSSGGGFGDDSFAASGNSFLTINGGHVDMNAGGDGLDSNGSIVMTGGTVMVDGPTNDGNGAVDYNGTFRMTGGFLLAVGSAGMAEAPDDTSTQNAMLVGFSATQQAGTLIHVEAADGTGILTYAPEKQYSSFVFSSPDLVSGGSYNVYAGGTADGTQTNGLYMDGTWSGGTEAASMTLSSVITTAGTIGGRMGGGGGMGGGKTRGTGRP